MKKDYIKIRKSKEQWLEVFLSNVEELNENEDFLHTDYPIPNGKDSIEVYKGMYNQDTGEVKLVYIYRKMRFMNEVVKFSGKIKEGEGESCLIGNFQPIYIDYWKEICTMPEILIFAAPLVIGIILQPSFLCDIIILFLIILVAIHTIPRVKAIAMKKSLIKWMKKI